MLLLAGPVLSVLAACAVGPAGDGGALGEATSAASSEGTGVPGTTGPARPDGGEGPSSSTADGSHDGGPMFDLGVPDAGASDEGCTRVDLLFVVDASYSMQDEQDNLVASFPGFVAGIADRLGDAHDWHVGVVTTEAYEWNDDGCDEALGQLVTRTGGKYSSGQACGPFAQGRFMTIEDDLSTSFACAADVGIQGDEWERPMEAMLTVVEGAHTEPGGCNEGFLRDDSLLVVVVITDEADGPGDPEGSDVPTQTSAGTPESWFADLVAARGGIESNIVVLALGMFAGGPCPPIEDGAGHVEGGVFDGANLHAFVGMFTHGFAGGICEPSYDAYFEQAVDVVATACEGFEPQG
jgi:hypothetical protein